MPSAPPVFSPLPLHDALPICRLRAAQRQVLLRGLPAPAPGGAGPPVRRAGRSKEHTSELQSLRHLVCRLLPPCSPLFPYTTLFRSAVSGLPSDRFCFEGFPPRRPGERGRRFAELADRKSTRLNSSHLGISYAVCSPRVLPSSPTRRSSDLPSPGCPATGSASRASRPGARGSGAAGSPSW